MARVGYASKAAVYMIIGLLALGTAFGSRGRTGDSREALRVIANQPFGRMLMWVVAAGLLGYALWRISSALYDSERRGSDAKGLAIRAGSFIRGGAYSLIAYEAMRMATRSSSGGQSSDAKAQHWTGRLMDAPFGRFLVIAAGLVIAGYGFYQLYRAVASKLGKHLRLGSMQDTPRRAVIAISRFGIGARAVIFGLIGYSIGKAAFARNASEARGTGGALRDIASYGQWPLAIIGAGLIAYGIYQLVNARYRIIQAV